MYKRILVPLDGSPLAEQVLPYVRVLAKGLQAPVALLRVIEPPRSDLADPTHHVYLDQIAAAFQSQARDYLDRTAASLRRAELEVSRTVHEGNPAEHIVREAEQEPATLIAMSTHGRSGIGRWAMGSTADKVLHAATNPLLLSRSREEGASTPAIKLSTIIVPLDGSPQAEQVLPHTVALAKALNLKVMLVKVTPSAASYYQYWEYPVPYYEDVAREIDHEATEYLKEVATKLRRQGVSNSVPSLLHGNPAAAIVDTAQGVSDNLVAITTHGRSGMARWVLGSVADRVVRLSGDPVLVIRVVEESQQAAS